MRHATGHSPGMCHSRDEELAQLRTLTRGGLAWPGTRGTPLLFKHEERKKEWVWRGMQARFCQEGQAFPLQAVHLLGREQQDKRALFQKAGRRLKELSGQRSRQERRNRKGWSSMVVRVSQCVDGKYSNHVVIIVT